MSLYIYLRLTWCQFLIWSSRKQQPTITNQLRFASIVGLNCSLVPFCNEAFILVMCMYILVASPLKIFYDQIGGLMPICKLIFKYLCILTFCMPGTLPFKRIGR